MKHEDINFKYQSSWDSFEIIEDSNTPIYYFKNFKIGNFSGDSFNLHGQYFLMSRVDQYFHFLKEYFGSYLYLKNKILPSINYLFIYNDVEKDSPDDYFIDNIIESVMLKIKQNKGTAINQDFLNKGYVYISDFYMTFDHGKALIDYKKHFKHNGMPDIIKELRYFYSDSMVDNPSSPKKIFISRRLASSSQDYLVKTGQRAFRYYDRHINDALEDFFSDLGYSIIELYGINIEKQVELFYNATHIAGPLGTGFFNGIFSKPGTKFISVNRNPRYFFDFEGEIKSVIDCEFYYHQLEEHPDYQSFKESLNRIINKEIC